LYLIIKVKVTPKQATTSSEGERRYSSTPMLNFTARRDVWSTPHPDRYIHEKEERAQVSIVQEVGRAPGLVRTSVEVTGFEP
jgi:hypothetical protein